MKLSNLLTKTMICAALTAAPIMSSFSHAAPPVKKASEGGASGGGGNAANKKILKAEDLREKLKTLDIRIFAESLLYRFEGRRVIGGNFSKADDVQLNSAAEKLKNYGLAQAVYDIKTVQFNAQPNEKCIDPNTKKQTDAYADAKNKIICFDLKRLQKKNITNANFGNVMGALLVHEISHFFGTTEGEADAIQQFSQDYKISMNNLSGLKLTLSKSLGEMSLLIGNSLENFDRLSQIQICQILATQTAQARQVFTNFFSDAEKTGTFLIPVSISMRTSSLHNHLSYTSKAYCLEGQFRTDPRTNLDVNSMFGGPRLYNDGITTLAIDFADKATTKTNLEEAKRVTDDLLLKVNASAVKGYCTFDKKQRDLFDVANFSSVCGYNVHFDE